MMDPNVMAERAQSLNHMSQERRAAVRYPIDARVRYRVMAANTKRISHVGRVMNMSRNGILFETEERLDTGIAVELWIEWPARPYRSERWLYVGGRVVRQSGRGVAVAIRHYSFEDECRIE